MSGGTPSPKHDRKDLLALQALFKSYSGHAMSFFVNIGRPPELKKRVEKMIEACGGRVEVKVEDIHERTAVLIYPEAESKLISYKGFNFEARYIEDCAEQGILLDMNDYVLNTPKGVRPNSTNFFDVFFWENTKLPQVADAGGDNVSTGDNSSSSSSSIWHSSRKPNSTSQIRKPFVNKNSRMPYSRLEKEAILKFIIAKKAYSSVKGNRLYMNMEDHNICPVRTYQSMRNHFLKVIIKELDTFRFLTDEQKRMLRDNV